jgi:hypothetical protein
LKKVCRKAGKDKTISVQKEKRAVFVSKSRIRVEKIVSVSNIDIRIEKYLRIENLLCIKKTFGQGSAATQIFSALKNVFRVEKYFQYR